MSLVACHSKWVVEILSNEVGRQEQVVFDGWAEKREELEDGNRQDIADDGDEEQDGDLHGKDIVAVDVVVARLVFRVLHLLQAPLPARVGRPQLIVLLVDVRHIVAVWVFPFYILRPHGLNEWAW